MTHRPPPAAVRLAALFALLCAALAVPGVSGTAHALGTNTVVTLGFDDGVKDQFTNARPILQSHHMRGTFYINSGQTNLTNYMTQADIAALASDGDEIAGHTVDHADLTTLSSDDAKREVCNDRVTLLGWGFKVKNFAYPYGSENAATEQIVRDCGYNSARAVGGVVSPGSCDGCGYAETIPPADVYNMQTPDSIKSDTSLATLKSLVTNAELHGGGWVQLVFHHVCDGCTDTYSVSPSTLSDFLDWLSLRALLGTTVKTVDQVIGGAQQPPVNGPPLNPPTHGNLVQNPSLESASNGLPACFQYGGYGTNTYTWTRSTDAHTGSYSQQLDVTALTSGDRKLVTKQDANTCAPVATPGHVYNASAWYKGSWGADVQVKLTLYYRTSAGTWVYWTSGPALPATSTWTKTPAFTSPAAPADATGLSMGISLAGTGTIYTDDYDVTDPANP
ncbi:polysaccharide deacetylase family protein [Actinoallomurus sp. NPDC052308]|uniref:polysaccharide deacetylase family protein n=1 Tax=Actinoallomurus sp. NPDC052308 TaxID=3155530 RepID=UPI0034252A40